MEEETRPLILILCTGNSCRSHMAEGVLREVAGDVLNVQSAGSDPAGFVHPLAILTLAEIGIDISSHTSKHMDEFLSGNVETVITVCDNANQVCPAFPGQANRHHWPFPDPAKAEIIFLQSIELAKSQKSKLWELRSATSLARLWGEGKERQKAYDLLFPIYDWYTEGFDTFDLKEGKALLQELQ